MDVNEVKLIRDVIAGDRQAYNLLVRRMLPSLIALAGSIVGFSDAEDMVQDSLITAWRKLSSLRDPGKFSPWLKRILVRTCFAHVKRSRFEELDASGIPGNFPEPDSLMDVQRALAQLAPRQRAVMHLTVIEEMSDSRIAGILSIRPGSVRAHRRRARNTLRRFLEGEF